MGPAIYPAKKSGFFHNKHLPYLKERNIINILTYDKNTTKLCFIMGRHCLNNRTKELENAEKSEI
jgi:hypothetical protein